MSATASWLLRHRFEAGWVVFAAGNLGVMGLYAGHDGGTVPFHFIWVSLTLLYGYTVWRIGPTAIVLALVMVSTAGMILLEVVQGPTSAYELTEVPLMAAMFLAMVWHARNRMAAEQEAIRSREREREFIRDSSHHLKTPLQLARSYAELAGAGIAGEDHRQDTDALIVELDRMAKIVNGLLVFITSEQPQLIERRPTDLEELLIGITGRWMDAVDRNWTVDVKTPGTLFVDSHRLEYAIDALIENAVAATTPGGQISVIAEGMEATASIRIIDNGHGIAAAAIEHVFERFWTRAGRTERRGTGLGLAIAKTIVDAHKGSIEVRSGTWGTEFTLVFDTFAPAGIPERRIAPRDAGRRPSSVVPTAL
jgi:two-component system OmpR family sensor kinase